MGQIYAYQMYVERLRAFDLFTALAGTVLRFEGDRSVTGAV